VPRERLGNHGAVTMLSPIDGRVMFALPAGPLAIIGTTDTPTTEHPREVRASRDDVVYLLRSANAFFPNAALTEADVVSAWAGIRPLAAGGYREGSAPASASREHAIAVAASGVIHVSGGKLTTYRSMAAQIVDSAEQRLGRKPKRAPTNRTPLPGGALASLDDEIETARRSIGRDAVAVRLVRAYGNRWREVWSLV
jgi:glycerol-3-phosphate dehydrogenase